MGVTAEEWGRQSAALAPPARVLALPLAAEVKDALAAARRAWFGAYSAKELARLVGCKVETAQRYREGAMPNGPQLAAFAAHWGAGFLEAIFEPVLNPAGETVEQRLVRIEREAAAALADIAAERRKVARDGVARDGAATDRAATGAAAKGGAENRRVGHAGTAADGTPDAPAGGARAAGGGGGLDARGAGADAARGGAGPAGARRGLTAGGLTAAGRRGALTGAALLVAAVSVLSAFADDAAAQEMRRPSAQRVRPPIVRIWRRGGEG